METPDGMCTTYIWAGSKIPTRADLKKPADLELSGVEVVLAGGILAIIGAITLQHGSVVASKVVQERILARVQNL